jgi:hypothetical protein
MSPAVADQFGSPVALEQYLKLIVQPPCRAWRYQLNGKSGSTFTLNLLFELEYGHPFRAHVSTFETGNQHSDFALFAQLEAGLLDTALHQCDGWHDFRAFSGLRLATVRNPYHRAVSGFHYLCRSHTLGDRRFLPERLRLMALADFDFERDCGTVAGFDRFLGYVRDFATSFGHEAVDPHWRAQALNIRPELYEPDLVGRVEAMSDFALEVARRLDRPLISDLACLRRNRAVFDSPEDLLGSPNIRRKIEQIYAADFDLFEYPLDRAG